MGRPKTTRGYDVFEVISALQKAIRRGDAKLAGYWAVELFESGFHQCAWNTLLVISASLHYEIVRPFWPGFSRNRCPLSMVPRCWCKPSVPTHSSVGKSPARRGALPSEIKSDIENERGGGLRSKEDYTNDKNQNSQPGEK